MQRSKQDPCYYLFIGLLIISILENLKNPIEFILLIWKDMIKAIDAYLTKGETVGNSSQFIRFKVSL
jgi:hypothetical protein